MNETKEMEKLQRNLGLIRKLAGWSMEDLGNKIGVTKQTISNLENKPEKKITFIQYAGIRRVLDQEIEKRKKRTENADENADEDILVQVVELIFSDDFDEKDEESLKDAFSFLNSMEKGQTKIPDTVKNTGQYDHCGAGNGTVV